MKLFKCFPALLALTLLSACAQWPATPRAPATPSGTTQKRPAPLILISIDGFRPDYLARGVTPVLSRLAQQGALAAQGMRPSFPSLTFPNHYTLVTGLTPDRHGVINNTMTDEKIPDVLFTLSNRAALADRRWWDGATPLWVSAEQQGLKTATMFWPGSETDIQGVRPSDWLTYDHNFPPDARVDQLLEWLDREPSTRPDFLTLYFEAVDSAGHRFGPDAAETTAAVASIDQAIGRLIEGLTTRGLLPQTNLVIVSDHGMASMSAQRVVLLDEMLAIDSVQRFLPYGPLQGFTPLAGREAEVRTRLAQPQQHVQCWPKAELPARFDYGKNARVPPFICLAEIGWALATRESLLRNPPSGGSHGYDPDEAQMAALFIARGPAFAPGVELPRFANVDVYALLAQLLGIKPQAHQGRLDTFKPARSAQRPD